MGGLKGTSGSNLAREGFLSVLELPVD